MPCILESIRIQNGTIHDDQRNISLIKKEEKWNFSFFMQEIDQVSGSIVAIETEEKPKRIMKITLMKRVCIIKAIAQEISNTKKIKDNDIKTKSNVVSNINIETESKDFLKKNRYVLFLRPLYTNKENVQCWCAKLQKSFSYVEILEVVRDLLSLDKYLQELNQKEFSYKTIIHKGTKLDKDLLPEIEIEQELNVFKICFD